ncbi:hypothetical protein ABPG77_002119, partial [Micractinium sp. CCAP 211/92]
NACFCFLHRKARQARGTGDSSDVKDVSALAQRLREQIRRGEDSGLPFALMRSMRKKGVRSAAISGPPEAAAGDQRGAAAVAAAPNEFANLRDLALRAAADPLETRQLIMTAWVHALRHLPGAQPELLGAMPAVNVLLPSDPRKLHPAGLLMLHVRLPPPRQHAGGRHPLGRHHTGVEEAAACLRLLVYSLQDGRLLERKDWLARGQGLPLPAHPAFARPTWDSGDGWAVLFPDPRAERHQAELFSGHSSCSRQPVPLPMLFCTLGLIVCSCPLHLPRQSSLPNILTAIPSQQGRTPVRCSACSVLQPAADGF